MMVQFVDRDEAEPRMALGAAGVRFARSVDAAGSVDAALLDLVLAPDVRHSRGELVAEPPRPSDAETGMGAWHVNAVDELHSVLDGEGVMEFQTDDGVVCVRVEGGDVILIQGAEHRYRPVTEQRWIVRWAGTPSTELSPRETGRESAPWLA